jgi:HEAT repeat protein
MIFYTLSKSQRAQLVLEIYNDILADIRYNRTEKVLLYFSDDDTYIRKAAYLNIGKIYFIHKELAITIIALLHKLLISEEYKIRQTVINAAGEIGKKDFAIAEIFFDSALFDKHHSVRNAVIGSIKKMSEKNPVPVLQWAQKYLHHADKEIRREICHGIELRGRTHPQDILPLLKQLQYDTTARVRNTLVHVIGQIAYKKGCLHTVIEDLNNWENKLLVAQAIEEIIDVHYRYRNFAVLTQKQAIEYIKQNFKN